MQRHEIEREVRSVRRWCRGLPLLTPEKQRKAFDAFYVFQDGNEFQRALDFTKKLADLIGIDEIPAVPFGNWESMFRVFGWVATAHEDCINKTCGYDFNETVLAGPFDGQEHGYICPKCGQTGTYIAPIFDMNDGD